MGLISIDVLTKNILKNLVYISSVKYIRTLKYIVIPLNDC